MFTHPKSIEILERFMFFSPARPIGLRFSAPVLLVTAISTRGFLAGVSQQGGMTLEARGYRNAGQAYVFDRGEDGLTLLAWCSATLSRELQTIATIERVELGRGRLFSKQRLVRNEAQMPRRTKIGTTALPMSSARTGGSTFGPELSSEIVRA